MAYRAIPKEVLYSVLAVGTLAVVALVIRALCSCRAYSIKQRLFRQFRQHMLEPPKMSLRHDTPVNDQCDALGWDDSFTISADRISVKEMLGIGNNSLVHRGIVVGSFGMKQVAVKKPRTDSMDDKQALMDELKVLIFIGKHPNVISLIGGIHENLIDSGELLVVLEYCALGDLRSFVSQFRVSLDSDNVATERTHMFVNEILRQHFTQYVDAYEEDAVLDDLQCLPSSTQAIPTTVYRGEEDANWDEKMVAMSPNKHNGYLFTGDLLSIGYQVAKGMDYLTEKGIIHRDLAARNVLLTKELIPKISDFGLSKQWDWKNNKYLKGDGTDKVPLKWTAMEGLERNPKFSVKSDVWSYGIVLYEMFTLGLVPYENESDIDSCSKLLAHLHSGKRLPQPQYAPSEIYALMRDCWLERSGDRPTFTQCCDKVCTELERCSPSRCQLDEWRRSASAGNPLNDEVSETVHSSVIIRTVKHLVHKTRLRAKDRDWLNGTLALVASALLLAAIGTFYAVYAALYISKYECAVKYLGPGATVFSRDAYGQTPLMLAVWDKDAYCVREILAHPRSAQFVNMQDYWNNFTALHMATATITRPYTMLLLLQHPAIKLYIGADRYNLPGSYISLNYMPLHAANQEQCVGCVKALLANKQSNKYNVNTFEKQIYRFGGPPSMSITPMDYAISVKNKQLQKIMEGKNGYCYACCWGCIFIPPDTAASNSTSMMPVF